MGNFTFFKKLNKITPDHISNPIQKTNKETNQETKEKDLQSSNIQSSDIQSSESSFLYSYKHTQYPNIITPTLNPVNNHYYNAQINRNSLSLDSQINEVKINQEKIDDQKRNSISKNSISRKSKKIISPRLEAFKNKISIKKCKSTKQLTNCVSSVSNFLTEVINTNYNSYKDENFII